MAQATGPCQVLAAYDASFAAGLLEAAVQGVCEARDMLLVAYDAAAALLPPPRGRPAAGPVTTTHTEREEDAGPSLNLFDSRGDD